MKYSSLTISLLLLAASITFTTADDPIPPAVPGVAGNPIEETEQLTESDRQQRCPPSPQPKPWLMIPHGGMHTEGCERVALQDLEIDFDGTQIIAEEMRREMLKQQPTWTAERTERARQEDARGIVTDLSQIIRNEEAAIALGKSFFWDTQVGSDGQTACASCHFKAGADARPDGSMGVARRVLRHDQDIADDGTEPSEELTDDLIVLVYRNRWSKMVEFDNVITDLAIHGLKRLIQIAELRSDEMADVFAEMNKTTLTTTHQEILILWERLKSFQPASPPNSPQPTPEEFKTRIELVIYALEYTRQTSDVAELADQAQVTTNYSNDLWKALSSKQVGPSRQAPALKLGARMSPFQQMDGPESRADIQQRKVASKKASDQRETNLPNSPTVINAALHDRLFHDGRAASVFNGYDHLGDEAGRDGYGKWMFRNGRWRRVLVRIPDAALASQATAPLLSVAEMSWFGRQYHHVARKLLDRRPLQFQTVKPDDSHLAGYVAAVGAGLSVTYRELIQKAFRPEWWSGADVPSVAECDALTGDPLALKQIEANFSLFWGIALMAYQNELISNQSEFDTLMADRRKGLSLYENRSQEEQTHIRTVLKGFKTFQDHACADCHRAPEFAGATRATVYGPILEFEGPLDAINAETEQNEFANWLATGQPGIDARIERMPFRPEMAPRFYDSGFYNIGITPDDPRRTEFHPGVDGEVRMDLANQQGALLSIVQRFGQGLVSDLLLDRDSYVTHSLARRYNDRWSNVVGSFKTPTMRNVTLTAPYFHNGQTPDLGGVLEHYDNPVNNIESQQSGSTKKETFTNLHLHPAVLKTNTAPAETEIPDNLKSSVLIFLESLSDPRVRNHEAPFDRPSLLIPTSSEVDARGRTAEANLRPASDF